MLTESYSKDLVEDADGKLFKRFGGGFCKLVMLKITWKKFVCGYAMAKDTIYSLRVCNGSTVKGIKLVTDFLNQLHKEGNLQNRVFAV